MTACGGPKEIAPVKISNGDYPAGEAYIFPHEGRGLSQKTAPAKPYCRVQAALEASGCHMRPHSSCVSIGKMGDGFNTPLILTE